MKLILAKIRAVFLRAAHPHDQAENWLLGTRNSKIAFCLKIG
jgi:hypothetical protein